LEPTLSACTTIALVYLSRYEHSCGGAGTAQRARGGGVAALPPRLPRRATRLLIVLLLLQEASRHFCWRRSLELGRRRDQAAQTAARRDAGRLFIPECRRETQAGREGACVWPRAGPSRRRACLPLPGQAPTALRGRPVTLFRSCRVAMACAEPAAPPHAAPEPQVVAASSSGCGDALVSRLRAYFRDTPPEPEGGAEADPLRARAAACSRRLCALWGVRRSAHAAAAGHGACRSRRRGAGAVAGGRLAGALCRDAAESRAASARVRAPAAQRAARAG
jgi:hypothetical protein